MSVPPVSKRLVLGRKPVNWRGFPLEKPPPQEWFEAQQKYLSSLSDYEMYLLKEYSLNEKHIKEFVRNGFKVTDGIKEDYPYEQTLRSIAPTIDDLQNGLMYHFLTLMRIILAAPRASAPFVVFRGFKTADAARVFTSRGARWEAGPGLTSTSFSFEQAATFGDNVVRINIPTNAPTLYVAPVAEYPEEREVLLPCNGSFGWMRGSLEEHSIELTLIGTRPSVLPNLSTPFHAPARAPVGFFLPREPPREWFHAQAMFVDSLLNDEVDLILGYIGNDVLFNAYVENKYELTKVHIDAYRTSGFLQMISPNIEELRDNMYIAYQKIQKILFAAPRSEVPFVVFRQWGRRQGQEAFSYENDVPDDDGKLDEGLWTPKPKALGTTLDFLELPKRAWNVARINVPAGVPSLYLSLLAENENIRDVLLPSTGKLRKVWGEFMPPQGYTVELEYVQLPAIFRQPFRTQSGPPMSEDEDEEMDE